MLSPGLTAIAFYFNKRRGLASGVCTAGANLGGIVLPFVIRYSSDHYGLPGCLLILAGIQLNTLVAALLIRPVSFYDKRMGHDSAEELTALEQDTSAEQPPSPYEETGEQGSAKSSELKTTSQCFVLCHNTHFLMLFICFVTTNCGVFAQYLVIPNVVLEFGFSKQTVAVLMAVLSATDLVFSLATGYIIDRDVVDRVTLLIFSSLVLGIAGVLVPLHPALWVLALYCALFGLLGSVHLTLMVPLVAGCVQLRQLSMALALIWGICSIVTAAALAIVGTNLSITYHHRLIQYQLKS